MNKVLAGYRTPLVAGAGDTVDFKVHCADGGAYQADLIRIINGDSDPAGPGLVFEEINAPFAGCHDGVAQPIRSGSFARLPVSAAVDTPDLTLALAVFPTLFNGAQQTIADVTDASGVRRVRLQLDTQGHLTADANGATARVPVQIPLDRWSFIGAAVDAAARTLTIWQRPQPNGAGDDAPLRARETAASFSEDHNAPPAMVTIAADWTADATPAACFNGRIEAPRLVADALTIEGGIEIVRAENAPPGDPALLGFWDFSKGIDTREVRDLGPGGRVGDVINLPVRAVRGFRWTGDVRDWKQAPREYGAIHFHDTDVYDMGWPTAFSYTVPDGLRSGAYAARLRRGEETEYITFFVRPPVTKRTDQPSIVFVAPTASYLAYSNETAHVAVTRALYGESVALLPEVQQFLDNQGFGRSQYQAHDDGSGVHYVSQNRPIWNLRPDTRAWAFPADTTIIHWLETRGYAYDVITDHDIQEHGAAILNNYKVAITGTHPEYLSTEIYDAYEGFLGTGGRLMYMGGNGFYWRVAFSDAWPDAMEVRRAEDGTRAWVAEPGEYYHAFDGEMGGLWRRQGRSPNRLVGIGFTAQGFTTSSHYRRQPDADNARAAFIMEGVDADIIGDFGLREGGAAGEEIDRFDTALGSPPHGLVLASSEDHAPDMMLVNEEFLFTLPPNLDPRIRADITFYETPSGGAVFSTGSIAYAGSLSHNGFDNPIARMTENVLNRFADPVPFEMPDPQDVDVPSDRASVFTGQRITA